MSNFIVLYDRIDVTLQDRSCPKRCGATDVGHEGASMFKRNGLYYLTAADTYEGRYSSSRTTKADGGVRFSATASSRLSVRCLA